MKKDISFPTVVGVAIAIVRKMNESRVAEWFVIFINDNDVALENVMIVSRGYGEINGESRETSLLRHAFGTINPKSNVVVEPIDASVFVLNNEYWVSYFIDNQMYDKRFTFVPDTITEDNLIKISSLNMMGILHE